MKEETITALKKEFHGLNNLLNKITTQSGLARYQLETKGLDSANVEEEAKKLIKLLSDLEDYALKIGEILRNINKLS